jgi:hypothetical protein
MNQNLQVHIRPTFVYRTQGISIEVCEQNIIRLYPKPQMLMQHVVQKMMGLGAVAGGGQVIGMLG